MAYGRCLLFGWVFFLFFIVLLYGFTFFFAFLVFKKNSFFLEFIDAIIRTTPEISCFFLCEGFENHGALIMLSIWSLFHSHSSPNILSEENANNTDRPVGTTSLYYNWVILHDDMDQI